MIKAHRTLRVRWTSSFFLMLAAAWLVALPGCSDSDEATTDSGNSADITTVADSGNSSDTGNAPDSGGDANVAADSGPAAEPTCAAYCALVQQACGQDAPQYDGEADCLDYCTVRGKLPVGSAGDQSGNTIGCRMFAAGMATNGGIPAVWCVKAGPSGGMTCGTFCENYCHLAQANCTGDNELYASTGDCTQACAAFPIATGPTSVNPASGDSVQCRIYHLGLAGADASAATTHCPHGAAASSVCQ